MPASASVTAVRSERCTAIATSKRSARSLAAIACMPASPLSLPRLSKVRTRSGPTSGAISGAASGRVNHQISASGNASRSARHSGVVSTTSPRKLVCASSRRRGRFSAFVARLPGGRLVDEHHGDVVLDAGAAAAGQRVALRRELDVALALGTDQDVEQLLTDRHEILLARRDLALQPLELRREPVAQRRPRLPAELLARGVGERVRVAHVALLPLR